MKPTETGFQSMLIHQTYQCQNLAEFVALDQSLDGIVSVCGQLAFGWDFCESALQASSCSEKNPLTVGSCRYAALDLRYLHYDKLLHFHWQHDVDVVVAQLMRLCLRFYVNTVLMGAAARLRCS